MGSALSLAREKTSPALKRRPLDQAGKGFSSNNQRGCRVGGSSEKRRLKKCDVQLRESRKRKKENPRVLPSNIKILISRGVKQMTQRSV